MSDDQRQPPDDSNPPKPPHSSDDSSADDAAEKDIAPSTIFVEMMRQAAARRSSSESKSTEKPLSGKAGLPPAFEDDPPFAPDSAEEPRPTRSRPLIDPVRPRRPRPSSPLRQADSEQHKTPDQARPAPVQKAKESKPDPEPESPAKESEATAAAELPAEMPPAPVGEAIPLRTTRRPSTVSLNLSDEADAAADEVDTGRVPVYTPQPEQAAPVDDNDARLKAERIQRVKRRKERAHRRRIGIAGGFVHTTFIVLIAAGLAATIFTWFTSPDFLTPDVVTGLVVAETAAPVASAPTAMPTPNWLRRIGIVSGHRGSIPPDPGAVCPDGLTEAEINFNVAQYVVRNLRARGYSVDLLDEFDPRLDNYQAAALVSIHANTCQDFGEFVSGFLVAKAAARPEGGLDQLLAECVAEHYRIHSNLERRFTLTLDMTDYHTFREIHPLTPAAIVELGFMKDDRQLLVEQPEALALGITQGILCYLEPSSNVLPGAPASAEDSAESTPEVSGSEASS